jgi:hypothetical protein
MTYYGDNAPQLAASVITLAVIAYVVFGLRVFTRVRNGAFGVDDWCMTAATVSVLVTLLSLIRSAEDPGSLHCFNRCMHRRCI